MYKSGMNLFKSVIFMNLKWVAQAQTNDEPCSGHPVEVTLPEKIQKIV